MRLRDAKKLSHGDILESKTWKNADGTPTRFRISGAVKTLKRNSDYVRIPIKHGLYWNGYLYNDSSAIAPGKNMIHIHDVVIQK